MIIYNREVNVKNTELYLGHNQITEIKNLDSLTLTYLSLDENILKKISLQFCIFHKLSKNYKYELPMLSLFNQCIIYIERNEIPKQGLDNICKFNDKMIDL